jgi:hypothetical protein
MESHGLLSASTLKSRSMELLTGSSSPKKALILY